jgi:hypothetical protein
MSIILSGFIEGLAFGRPNADLNVLSLNDYGEGRMRNIFRHKKKLFLSVSFKT